MKRVMLLYGGRSSEHAISCLSARAVLGAIDRSRYEVLPVGITRSGRWTLTDGIIPPATETSLPEVADDAPTAAIVGTRDGPLFVELDDAGQRVAAHGLVDVAFPALHGPWGEDGTIQGLLATVGVPYVGADVTASSIGIDKAAMKATFTAAGLPQADYVAVHRQRWAENPSDVRTMLADRLALPWFVKPTRQGSSIGISRVDTLEALDDALALAFTFDDAAVIEVGIVDGRELEVGVLGDRELWVTGPGEIIPAGEFYDFDAKYRAESTLIIPAAVDDEIRVAIDALAVAAYRAIGCRGLARIDFFVSESRGVLVNEINTIPGFTERSMFPRLWAHEGLDYPSLVDRLLTDAIAVAARGRA